MDAATIAALALQHNPWRACMYRNSALTLTSGGVHVFPYDTASYDPNSNLTTGASAAYNVPVDGYYSVAASYLFTSVAAANAFQALLYQNGSLVRAGTLDVSPAGAGSTISATLNVASLPCVAGDTLQIEYTVGTAFVIIVSGGVADNYAEFAFVAPR